MGQIKIKDHLSPAEAEVGAELGNNELRTATLDYFMWNSSLDNQISDAGVIHSPDNISDHEVIYCVVKEKVDV